MTRPIAIVSAGHTFPAIRTQWGDFHHWIAQGLGREVSTVHIDAQTADELPDPGEFAGAVITGSHSMVTEQLPWSERLASWLRTAVAAELPVLGICYGHQLLAHALGGKVGYHPGGIEIGSHVVELTDAALQDPLFSVSPPQFDALLVHAQSVLALPAGAILLGRNTHEPHQVFRFGRRAWGVQFHPEFNAAIMHAYIGQMQEQLARQGMAWRGMQAAVRDTPHAAALLGRFAAVVRVLPCGVGCTVPEASSPSARHRT